MGKVQIPYGKEKIEVEINDNNLQGVYFPNDVEKKEFAAEFSKNLENANFAEFMDGDERVVFIVNDGTRPTPTAKVLKVIYDDIKDKDIYFIIATGAHRAPNDEEYEYIFGKEVYQDLKAKDRIWSHDAKKDEMVYLGKSTNGTEMLSMGARN